MPITRGASLLEKAIVATLSGVGTIGRPSPARTCLPSWPEMARSAKAATGAMTRTDASISVRNVMISPRRYP